MDDVDGKICVEEARLNSLTRWQLIREYLGSLDRDERDTALHEYMENDEDALSDATLRALLMEDVLDWRNADL